MLISKLYLLSTLSFLFFIFCLSVAVASNYQEVTFSTEDGGRIVGSFYEGKKVRGVVFTHGAIFSKESWYSLSERLKKDGISSLAIDFRGYGNSVPGRSKELYYDVLGAVDYLEKRGIENIALVGGSMGGAAILGSLAHKVNTRIDKVVLLAPAGGEAIKSKTIQKLFIVSREDKFYPRVHALYAASSEPKELKVYSGTSHAQHIFKTEGEVDLTNLIITFLKDQQ
jgi:pimeloyl-ACP methyl ester carboxylesterase